MTRRHLRYLALGPAGLMAWLSAAGCSSEDSTTFPEAPDAASEAWQETGVETGADAGKDVTTEVPVDSAPDTSVEDASQDVVQEPACDSELPPWSDPCVLNDALGVFVSSSKGDDGANDGTKVKPYATVGKALQEAKKSGKGRVYLCAEAYEGAVTAQTGIAIFGGLDCGDLSEWKATTKHAKVKAKSGEVAALRVEPGTGNVWIGEVDFEGADAAEAGGTSFGAYVENAGVKLERLSIVAGKGKAGAAPEAMPDKAADGTQGNAGKPAVCSNPPSTLLGGEPVTSCAGESSSGMGGVAVLAADGASGTGGLPFHPSSSSPADGVGGVGGKLNLSPCTPGHDGASGPDGLGGTGGKSFGSLVNGQYVASDGEAGNAGLPGQGGGGGGASAGAAGCIGASGGGGGSGGCGGKAGAGGKGGGASIALVVLQSSDAVVLSNVMLGASDGGDGADGQAGGFGGEVGAGGVFGAGNTGGGVLKGCAGGSGGVGGRGGGGGGGGGGASIALLFSGKDPLTSPGSGSVQHSVGQAGKGGLGGAPSAQGGEAGLAEQTHSL